MKTSTVLSLRGRKAEINIRSKDIPIGLDRIYVRIYQDTQDCYLDMSEVKELLKEMEELNN